MNFKNTFAFLLGLLTWFALGLQFYLTKGSIANFLSYFTILSNLLIALNLTFSLVPNRRIGRFSNSLSTQSAIALYIFVVAFVYNLVLRGIPLTGWNMLINELLHVIVPILYILFYLIFKDRGSLQYKDALPWLLFPFLYLVYSLTRGTITNWYPYPFLNAANLGYAKVSMNIGLMILVFLIGALALIGISRSHRMTSNRMTK